MSSAVTGGPSPSVCAPLGGELTHQLSTPSGGTLPPSAPLLEESCIVKSDPRVSVVGTNWSCAGGNLDVANFCPGFPSTVLPGTMCGHSGPTGAGFVVVKATAKTIDQNVNNTFIVNTVDPNAPLPGPLNLNCPQLQVFAWAPRSDLPSIEGTIVEGGPAPGSNYFMDLSAFCDNGGGNTHVLSMLAYGLGLNSAPSGMANGLPGFVADKFTNLTNTIAAASSQIDPNVAATVQGYVAQAQNYFNSGVAETASNGYSCAMNSLASADETAKLVASIKADAILFVEDREHSIRMEGDLPLRCSPIAVPTCGCSVPPARGHRACAARRLRNSGLRCGQAE